MRNKFSLLMMEQLVMLVVFALAASLCLRGFAQARELNEENRCTQQAVLIARNAAEALKHFEGDAGKCAELLGGELEGDVISFEGNDYSIELIPQPTGLSDFKACTLKLYYEDKPVFQLKAAWQEGLK